VQDCPPVTVNATAARSDWYRLSAEDACRELGVDPGRGLDESEIVQRRERYGPNKLAEEKREPGWRAFLRQYRDLMQLVLLGAAIVSIAALQEFSTGIVIIGLTVLNALLARRQDAVIGVTDYIGIAA
jgi:P-type Ca2+ transporter type 2C